MSSHTNGMSSERAGAPGAAATIGEAIKAYADKQPDHIAFVSNGFDPFSYRELQRMILEVRSALRAAGLGRSARIAIALPDGPYSAATIVAVTCSAVSIPLNPRQTFREIDAAFTALPPDAVVLAKGTDSVVRRVAVRQRIQILEAVQAPDRAFGIIIDSATSAMPVVPSEQGELHTEAVAFILQTSGTTAKPKLIPPPTKTCWLPRRGCRVGSI